MPLEAGTKVATSTIDALKSQPLALAVIIINVLFLAAGGWMIHEVAGAAHTHRQAQAALLQQMAVNCSILKDKKS